MSSSKRKSAPRKINPSSPDEFHHGIDDLNQDKDKAETELLSKASSESETETESKENGKQTLDFQGSESGTDSDGDNHEDGHEDGEDHESESGQSYCSSSKLSSNSKHDNKNITNSKNQWMMCL